MSKFPTGKNLPSKRRKKKSASEWFKPKMVIKSRMESGTVKAPKKKYMTIAKKKKVMKLLQGSKRMQEVEAAAEMSRAGLQRAKLMKSLHRATKKRR